MTFVFILILLFMIDGSVGVYISPYINITTPKYTDRRIAIIVSGEIRSGNLTWYGGKLRNDKWKNMFGGDDPITPIQTTLEFLIKPYALYGGVDMFIYIQVNNKFKNESYRNHTETNEFDPGTYEPTIGDYRQCELYSNDPIFHPSTGNKVFCSTEYEHQVSNQFIEDYYFWSGQHIQNILLQQLYGQYRANMACKQYSLASNIKYKYKIRLRPDTAVLKPFPSIDQINFNGTRPLICNHTVYFANHALFPVGAEDSFNIGETEAMDHVLDRYMDITTKPFIYRPHLYHKYWSSESYLIGLLEERYHTCLDSFYDIWMVVIRKADYHPIQKDRDHVPGDDNWTIVPHKESLS